MDKIVACNVKRGVYRHELSAVCRSPQLCGAFEYITVHCPGLMDPSSRHKTYNAFRRHVDLLESISPNSPIYPQGLESKNSV